MIKTLVPLLLDLISPLTIQRISLGQEMILLGFKASFYNRNHVLGSIHETIYHLMAMLVQMKNPILLEASHNLCHICRSMSCWVSQILNFIVHLGEGFDDRQVWIDGLVIKVPLVLYLVQFLIIAVLLLVLEVLRAMGDAHKGIVQHQLSKFILASADRH